MTNGALISRGLEFIEPLEAPIDTPLPIDLLGTVRWNWQYFVIFKVL